MDLEGPSDPLFLTLLTFLLSFCVATPVKQHSKNHGILLGKKKYLG